MDSDDEFESIDTDHEGDLVEYVKTQDNIRKESNNIAPSVNTGQKFEDVKIQEIIDENQNEKVILSENFDNENIANKIPL